jgi:hypothetical protein
MRDGVDEDLDLALAAADEVDAADAGDLLHALLDLVLGDLGEVADRQVAGEGDREDGCGAGVELGDHGRVDAAGQVALDGGDLVADVLEGLVAVDLEFELEDDVGDALEVARGHALDAAERLEGLLDRVGDLGLHGLRVGARVDHGGRDDREVDAGEQLHADAREAVEAEHHERGDHHRREHGPADRDLGDLHGASFFFLEVFLAVLTGLAGLAGAASSGRGGST